MANKGIVEQLTALLTKGNAHITFEDSVKDIEFNKLGIIPNNLPHSIWMLVEHIRIAQADILEFSVNENYRELDWPGDYWPQQQAPSDEGAWESSLSQIRQDRDAFIALLHAPDVDLHAPFRYGSGQNLLREALLIAEHNSYHTGQIIVVRRLLNEWD